jgi:lipopolysaccharide/colanic/teichoic acid biosynthesis glycosyltransferase
MRQSVQDMCRLLSSGLPIQVSTPRAAGRRPLGQRSRRARGRSPAAARRRRAAAPPFTAAARPFARGGRPIARSRPPLAARAPNNGRMRQRDNDQAGRRAAVAGAALRKRALDLGLLLPVLPVACVLILAIAAGLLVVEGRPIFFVQRRLGRGRRPFTILKLRTMTTEADARRRTATRVGGWLRRRGLDELPQLFNVLAGDMSLVGPRPLTPADAARMAAEHAAFDDRFAEPPGLTGLAQICGVRGAALTAAVDSYYARRRSMTLDVAILLRTAWINVVGKRRGARPLPAGLS